MAFLKHRFFLHVFCGLLCIGVLTGLNARAAESAPQHKMPPVCEIRGQVAGLKQVAIGDTPTSFSGMETHISVSVLNRSARYKKNAAGDPCIRHQETELRTYKLCSPTRVKKGDVINGTEATYTGPTTPIGCLFDLVVVSKQ